MAMWKKIIVGLAVIIGVQVAVFACGSIYLFSGMCGSYPYKTVTSPNGEYKAVIYQFDCGATTGFSTQISVLEVGEEVPNESGNIFSSDGHPEQVAPDVTWVNEEHINVQKVPGVTVYTQEESWGLPWSSIKITYE